jgi:glutaredoxin
MSKVILYTLPTCPHCSEIKRILNNKNIAYDEVTDINVMKEKKFLEVPMLEIGENIMSYAEILNWDGNNSNFGVNNND